VIEIFIRLLPWLIVYPRFGKGVVLNRLEEFLWTCHSQFGFKYGHSTDMIVYILFELIDYYKQKSTSVFVTFRDASKAFNKITHWRLFRKVIDRHVALYLVNVLVFCYHHQTLSIRWSKSISSQLIVRNGVKQGYIISSRLAIFFYIKDFCVKLYDSKIDDSIGNILRNHLHYANDLCVISLYIGGMQELLFTCKEYGRSNNISCIVPKTMFSSPRVLKYMNLV